MVFEYYNEGLKNKFIETYDNTNCKTYYGRLLSKAKELEEHYNKDLCNFNQNELDMYLKSLRMVSEGLSRVSISVIRKYIDFANNLGFVETGINYAALISNYKNYVNVYINKEKYVTEHQLNEIVDNCINPQDACFFQMLYEGIMGDGLSEIRNLKIDDVDFENKTLTLTNEDAYEVKSKREITVSLKLLELIKEANKQEEYVKNNGEETNVLSKNIGLASPTDYIIKSKKGNEKEVILKETLIRRFIKIKDILGYSHLVPKSIFKSGIIKKLKTIKDENGLITIEDYRNITNEYGYKNENYYDALKTELEKYI